MATVPFSTRAWDQFGLWRKAKGGVQVKGCAWLRTLSPCGVGTLVTVYGRESGREHFPQLHQSLPSSWSEVADREGQVCPRKLKSTETAWKTETEIFVGEIRADK